MKVQKREGSKERTILIGLIVDKQVIGRFADKWDKKLFKSTWANTIADWCFSYFTRYNKAPGKKIQSLYESWAADNPSLDDDTVGLVEKFLANLSDEYESAAESNTEYVVDIAGRYFNEVRLRKLADQIVGDLDKGDMDKAEHRAAKWARMEVGLGAGIDVMQDRSAIQAALEEDQDNLVTYPGAMGEFTKGALTRDSLVSFMGPEKRGKTWWLIDLAWRGMLQRRNVAFFAVGDMSQNQMMRRFLARAAKRPWKPKEFKYPTAIDRSPDSSIAQTTLEDRSYDKALTAKEAYAAMDDLLAKKVKSKKTKLKLSCHPNSTITVAGIESVLQGWERTESWSPDIIVIDYADILAPPLGGQSESRDQVNATWKQMRAMSQARHCLVVTATQSDADSYDAPIIGRKNFSEDKRKLAHVTAIFGLNASEEEKEQQIMRLNYVVLREEDFSTLKCVHVAGCLSIGNPCVRSTF